MGDKTSLGDRMKGQYEVRAQTLLPRRTYTIIRLDGKAWHTYTRGLDKPFDAQLSADLCGAAAALCDQAQGAAFGYVQSDEVSVLLTDFATTSTEAWFDGNVQKIVSASASILTAEFNRRRMGRSDLLAGYDWPDWRLALFDSRVFTVPDRYEVANYFLWRQRDCVRNSIAGLAQAHFSHRELEGLRTDLVQEKLWRERGINWNDQPEVAKRGALIHQDGHEWSARPASMFSAAVGMPIALIPRMEDAE